MSKLNWIKSLASCGLAVTLAVGCSQPAAKPTTAHEEHEEHAHAHPTHGPHQGELIELGEEEYHAELVHDDAAGSLTIYLLDDHAEKTAPTEAADLTINLKVDGKAQQFKLAASPDAGDPAGKSSRFTSTDVALGEAIEQEDAAAQLVVEIEGKQYRGKIAHHDHDHEGDHDHEHEKEDH